ncbi:MAG: hypothetical protein JWN70_6247 [Planctomycetaceae bacterium]|nr:hypothetical protein [Planctomycetaceae bacterium]
MQRFSPIQNYSSFRTISLLLIGMGLGYAAGTISAPSSVLLAEVTEEPRREAFKAGAVANEPILREIAATLKRIETQVGRFPKNGLPEPEVTTPVRVLPVPKNR